LCAVTQGISVSEEQVAWANKHVCSDRLRVVFTDYRTMPADWAFDAIVSVRASCGGSLLLRTQDSGRCFCLAFRVE